MRTVDGRPAGEGGTSAGKHAVQQVERTFHGLASIVVVVAFQQGRIAFRLKTFDFPLMKWGWSVAWLRQFIDTAPGIEIVDKS